MLRSAPSAGIASVPCFLRDVGLVVQHLHRRQLAAAGLPTMRHAPAARRRIALLAHRLVAAAESRGWAALAALLRPALQAEADQDADQPAGSSGFDACSDGFVGLPSPPAAQQLQLGQ